MGRRTKYKCIYVLLGPHKVAYVGQTKDPVNRKSRYKTLTCKNQTEVYRSLLTHGFDKHQFVVLLVLPDSASRDEMDRQETYFFEQYKSQGYTMLNLKSPGWNGKPNEVARKRQSESHIGCVPWNKGKKGAQVAWNKGLKKQDYAAR